LLGVGGRGRNALLGRGRARRGRVGRGRVVIVIVINLGVGTGGIRLKGRERGDASCSAGKNKLNPVKQWPAFVSKSSDVFVVLYRL